MMDKMLPNFEASTRRTVAYLYGACTTLDDPYDAEYGWYGESGVIALIRERMQPLNPGRGGEPAPDPRTIERVLNVCWFLGNMDTSLYKYVDPGHRASGGGRKCILKGRSLTTAARFVNKGYPTHTIAARMNRQARSLGLGGWSVSARTIKRSVMDIEGALYEKVKKKSQGSSDKFGDWSMSSLGEGNQFKKQIECGHTYTSRAKWMKAMKERQKKTAPNYDGPGMSRAAIDGEGFELYPPIWPANGMAWLDESHMRLHLGNGAGLIVDGMKVMRIPMDENDEPCSVENGGVLPEEVYACNFK